MSGTSTSTLSITSSGSASTYTIYQPFPFTDLHGVNIADVEFINNENTNYGGIKLLDDPNGQGSAFMISSVASGTIINYYATIGGSILNFEPAKYPGQVGDSGDQITIQSVNTLISELFQGGTANTDYQNLTSVLYQTGLHNNTQIFVAPSGSLSLSPGSNFVLNAAQTLALDKIDAALFGTAATAYDATLDFDFTLGPNPNANNKRLDLIVTTNAAINPCFAAGTRILTPAGETQVEHLRAGDLVLTQNGEEHPIIWIGRRHIDITAHPSPDAVRPTIIEAGAIADGVPARRLTVSPDHALYLDGVLVPAKDLINWTTIRQDLSATEITYHHLELAQHSIIFAEAMPAETYLDTGHRHVFDNAEPATVLTRPTLMQQRRTRQSCVPLCTTGATLTAIRQRIAARQVGIRLG